MTRTQGIRIPPHRIAPDALWGTLGTATVWQTEAIWKRLQAGETVVYNGVTYRYVGAGQIAVSAPTRSRGTP